MAAIANVALSDSFNTQRIKINRSLKRLNNFANNESQVTANTVLANVVFTSSGNTNITGGSLLVTANTFHSGTLELSGLTATTSNSVAGAINEVSDNTIAFSIALG